MTTLSGLVRSRCPSRSLCISLRFHQRAARHSAAATGAKLHGMQQAQMLRDGLALIRERKANVAITDYFDKILAHYAAKLRCSTSGSPNRHLIRAG